MLDRYEVAPGSQLRLLQTCPSAWAPLYIEWCAVIWEMTGDPQTGRSGSVPWQHPDADMWAELARRRTQLEGVVM
jgi:hypothetical protein